ncbi:SIMPL domain-containing protein [Flavobacteriaceae bacterium TP-CH-4]|uniref:SIMPL domain-containing protein n=1 Tax=Pelagihabitans pacificus TaxID=2696054 RepID=A0A967E840_9FLAO|nr:SIMPL domain-containing protein [Pelagihabitans pacificus]NHF60904.1 SIMPL domain-containing protein [Pelagihabitans pacificus]
MKKGILSIIFILSSMGMMAQTNQNQISVSGVHTYSITPEYSSKMIVSLANVYYDTQTMGMSEIKSGYLDKLAKVGISSDRLTEDDLYYALMGYDKEGTIIEFKTNSLEEMKKFLKVKSIGVTKSDATLKTVLTEEQMAEYAKAAYGNAKKKAEAIAKKIGRTVGKAISINDSNSTKINESLYYGSNFESREYYISVSFELL